MNRFAYGLFFSFLALSSTAFGEGIPNDLHLNQVQVIGTHNSYRTDISPATLKWLQAVSPKAAEALDYKHTTLDRQLDGGVRQLEIDIYADTQGSQYSHPKGPEWERKSGIAPDADRSALFLRTIVVIRSTARPARDGTVGTRISL